MAVVSFRGDCPILGFALKAYAFLGMITQELHREIVLEKLVS